MANNIITGIFTGISVLLLTSSVQAQGRGRDRDRGYFNYNRGRNHSFVSVNIGPRFGYYRPYSYVGYRPRLYPRFGYRHFGPSFGIRVNILPIGYYPFYVGPARYYYNDGVYYRPYQSGGYEVVAPPLGAVVTQLPSGASVKVIDGQKFYEIGGTFYQEEINANNQLRYRVVGTDGVLNTAAPQEDAVYNEPPANYNVPNNLPASGLYNQLPSGCKTVVVNGQKLFVAPDGSYYQEQVNNNVVQYKIVGGEQQSATIR